MRSWSTPGRSIVGVTMTASVPVPSGGSPEDPLRELQLQDPAVRAKVKEILADAAHGKTDPAITAEELPSFLREQRQ